MDKNDSFTARRYDFVKNKISLSRLQVEGANQGVLNGGFALVEATLLMLLTGMLIIAIYSIDKKYKENEIELRHNFEREWSKL